MPATLENHAALVIGHPGHELRVHHWLETARPLTFVLTDGSGRGHQIAVGFDDHRSSKRPALDPGTSRIYELRVASPPHPGDYRLRVTLVQEGIRWFDELEATGGFIDLPLRLP